MDKLTLERAIAEAYASAPAEVQVLHTLEINHRAFTQPARVARWPLEPEPRRFSLRLEDDATYNPGAVVEFIGLPFEVTLPEKSENSPGEFTLRISGVGDYLDADLEAAALSGGRITAVYREYVMGREDDGPAQVWPGIVVSSPYLDASSGALTATGSVLDWVNRKYGRLYTPGRYPALVRG